MKSIVRFVFFFTISLNAQNWDWLSLATSLRVDGISRLETDANGNSYVAGWVEENILLSDNINIVSGSEYFTPFIGKYDESGIPIWAISIYADASSNFQTTRAVPNIFPSNDGGLLFYGEYLTKATIDGVELDSPREKNAYLSGLDSEGFLSWHERLASSDDQLAIGDLRQDGEGSIYLSGYFRGNMEIKGEEVYRERNTTFVLKLSQDRSLEWLYVPEVSPEGSTYSVGMVINTEGELYISGLFYGVVDFEDSQAIAGDMFGQYILKFDSDGEQLWMRYLSDANYVDIDGLSLDTYGNLYIAGELEGVLNFEGNTYDKEVGGGVYVVKYSPNGDPIWLHQYGGLGNGGANYPRMQMAYYNRIYLSGKYFDNVVFGAFVFEKENFFYGKNLFLLELNSEGDVVNAKDMADYLTMPDSEGQSDKSDDIYISGMSVDQAGDLLIGGIYAGRLFMNNQHVECYDYTFTIPHSGDLFIGKLSTGELSQTEEEKANAFLLASNVVDASAILYLEEPIRVRLLNINGQVLRSYTFTAGEHYIETSSYSSGMYILQYENSLGAHFQEKLFIAH